eukprot:TRINITY_DN8235_c0_g1_i1.p1 TRINITY_DN8235_c0_g1~~TRINITY_DN8235_c0_g1_i1.p1  ORF type:complete len:135 (+),score=24.54 TRINITY_DN8235_c0_g1_i1:52-456(+)
MEELFTAQVRLCSGKRMELSRKECQIRGDEGPLQGLLEYQEARLGRISSEFRRVNNSALLAAVEELSEAAAATMQEAMEQADRERSAIFKEFLSVLGTILQRDSYQVKPRQTRNTPSTSTPIQVDTVYFLQQLT